MRIGEILMEAGLVSETQLASALGEQARWGNRLGETLVQLGFLQEAALIRLLSDRMGFPGVDLHGRSIDPEVVEIIPAEIAHKYSCLPIVLEEKAGKKLLYVAMEDPSNLTAVDDLTFRTGCMIRACLAGPVQIRRAISICYDGVTLRSEPVLLDLDEPLRVGSQVSQEEMVDENWVDDLEGGGTSEAATEELVQAAPAAEATTAPAEPAETTTAAPPMQEAPSAAPNANSADLPMRQILQAMTRLLIDKELITREELMDEIESVRRLSSS